MSRTDDIYKPALAKANLPILTLDNNWHKLFTQTRETPEIKKLEKKLNDLLKEQGKMNEEQKKLKIVRKKLMDEILLLADRYGGQQNRAIEKAMDSHKAMVEECSERLQALEEKYRDLPDRIEEINYQLMIKTMEICYRRLEENQREIEYYEKRIQEIRAEFRENIVCKQERETNTYELYSYMHNIFGRDVIDIFDMHYNPEEYRTKKKGEDYIE